jgi:hypothetical protein
MTKSEDISTDLGTDHKQLGTPTVDRRKALGRLGLYTAPAMVALLLSHPAAALTPGA